MAANSATTPPPASRDVCAMISADELKTATGITANGVRSTSGGAEVCTWMSAESKGAIIQLYPSASGYESSRTAFEGLYDTKSETLTGVGDEAFYLGGKTGPFNTATISAKKGTNAVSVQVMGMGDLSTFKPEAIALANVFLGKL